MKILSIIFSLVVFIGFELYFIHDMQNKISNLQNQTHILELRSSNIYSNFYTPSPQGFGCKPGENIQVIPLSEQENKLSCAKEPSFERK